MVYLIIKVQGTEKTVVYASQDKAKAVRWAAVAEENAMLFANDFETEYYIKEMLLH